MNLYIAAKRCHGNVHRSVIMASVIMVLVMVLGTAYAGPDKKATEAKDAPAPAPEDPHRIQKGDYVRVHYGLSLLSGDLIVTSSQKRAEDPESKKAAWFFAPKKFGPENLIAGRESATPELARVVMGMKKGGKKSVRLTQEQGFGKADEKKVVSYPRTKIIPLKTRLSARDYVNRFHSFPVIGRQVPLTPYFPGKVIEADDTSVLLEANPADGKVVSSEFGNTRIRIRGEEIKMTLTPKPGAPFVLMGRNGIIRDIGETDFKVDYNHPGAGQELVLDVEIVSFTKASAFTSKEMAWVEDHDQGYQLAAEREKPMVMVLYAGWCGWSKRLLTETLKDPRIQDYWEEFVWVKVDSDKNREYHEFYEQSGFPMIVLVDADGNIVKKLDGFKDARSLAFELDQCLEGTFKG